MGFHIYEHERRYYTSCGHGEWYELKAFRETHVISRLWYEELTGNAALDELRESGWMYGVIRNALGDVVKVSRTTSDGDYKVIDMYDEYTVRDSSFYGQHRAYVESGNMAFFPIVVDDEHSLVVRMGKRTQCDYDATEGVWMWIEREA